MAKLSASRSGIYRFRGIFSFSIIILGVVIGLYITITALSPALVELPIVRQLTSKPEIIKKTVLDDRLYIPQIGVNVAIVTGDSEDALTRGAWHRMPQNGDPEKGGNFILSAHRFVMSWTPGKTVERSPFYNIDKLNVGDQLQVDYDGVRYTYAITKKYKVSPNQTDIEKISVEPKLTLYSCTLRGSADGRDVIEAHLVK